ncbi:hypothetical protein SPOG_02360 [Schizosaccharomyces cryophilus OY26]|uniref:Uncharacterized protein n=1 Tax=Schizosaccharomyces cryophilus (strain OY26 / ATCC MYA-4695 / CBS 11777 / NBRC 106824 / NRRL Y48691) TaxID=653667 RepID=S9VTI0_SCHCR|nr:uncharacterized protein SPOG_02360 [Schizosaccharomyces cryophilus OY26]EPY51183.1 hypothetical protein SPOG_02360 [Schizosaccharomyces cryophilus OY26]
MNQFVLEKFQAISPGFRQKALQWTVNFTKILSGFLYIAFVVLWSITAALFRRVLLPGFFIFRTVSFFIIKAASMLLLIIADPAILMIQSVYWYFIRAPARFILMVGVTLYPLYVLLSWAVFLGILTGFLLHTIFTALDSYVAPSTEEDSQMQDLPIISPFTSSLFNLRSNLEPPCKPADSTKSKVTASNLKKTESSVSLNGKDFKNQSSPQSSEKYDKEDSKVPPVETRIIAEFPIPQPARKRKHRSKKSTGSASINP